MNVFRDFAHRRDAEPAEITQRKTELDSLRRTFVFAGLCALASLREITVSSDTFHAKGAKPLRKTAKLDTARTLPSSSDVQLEGEERILSDYRGVLVTPGHELRRLGIIE